MPLKLNSSGGGSVTLDVPVTGSALTVTVPALTGTVVTTGDTGTVTETMLAANSVNTAEIVASAVTPAKLSQPVTLMTANSAITGSTFVDFTGIPSWANRINVILSGVSTSGASAVLIQLGSTTITNTGYTAGAFGTTGSAVAGANYTTGFGIESGASVLVATAIRHGTATFINFNGNSWTGSGVIYQSQSTLGSFFTGSVTLGGSLDRVRITTLNGTDTFDAGTINVMYD